MVGGSTRGSSKAICSCPGENPSFNTICRRRATNQYGAALAVQWLEPPGPGKTDVLGERSAKQNVDR